MKIRLDDIEKHEPYQAPDNYFESLQDRIMDRIEESQKPVRKDVKINPWLKYAAAACLAIIAVLVLQINQPEDTLTASEILAQVSDDAIVEYIAEAEISTEDILEYAEFTARDIEAIQEEAFSDYDLESLDLMIEELELIQQ